MRRWTVPQHEIVCQENQVQTEILCVATTIDPLYGINRSHKYLYHGEAVLYLFMYEVTIK